MLKINLSHSSVFLPVHENDEPSQIAKEFCDKHHLNSETFLILEQAIEKNIDNLLISSESKLDQNPFFSTEEDTKSNELEEKFGSVSKMKTQGSLKMSDLDSPQKSCSKNSLFAPSAHLYSSKLIINKVKLHRFKKIFEYLNPNFMGKINSEGMAKLNLNEKLYKTLRPIIIEVMFTKVTLSYREFCQRMEVLLRKLSTADKYYILSSNLHVPLFELPNRHRLSRINHYEHQIRGVRSLSPSKQRLAY